MRVISAKRFYDNDCKSAEREFNLKENQFIGDRLDRGPGVNSI
jgi:hypothetical protein